VLRSDQPVPDERIRAIAPSIFAEAPYASRSARYAYISTAALLAKLREEDFLPFMVCQTRVRREDRCEYTKHLLRLRHTRQLVEYLPQRTSQFPK
jgi:hypothetical protein